MSKIVNLLKLKDYITLTGTTLGLIAVLLVTLGGRAYVSLGFFLDFILVLCSAHK